MSSFTITKGHDIRIAGRAESTIIDDNPTHRVALQPLEFRGIRPRPTVEVGQRVKLGTELFVDKNHPEIRFLSPGAGTVSAIRRGARRVLTEIIVDLAAEEEAETFAPQTVDAVSGLTRDQARHALLERGLWPFLRQRPFGKVPPPDSTPKSIFVQGMDTEPLALDPNLVLQGEDEPFQAGLNLLRRLTEGPIHLCVQADTTSAGALENAQGVEVHRFAGPHPAGLPGTHIHFIDPVRDDETVWYVKAVEVLDIGRAWLTGRFPVERVVALAGPSVKQPAHVRTRVGVSLTDLTRDRIQEGNHRYVSGTVLNGLSVGAEGFLRFGDRTVTVLPEGGPRQFLAWARLGSDRYSVSHAYPSGLAPQEEHVFDTRLHGGPRALVDIGQYDAVMPLNLMPVPLIKSILANDLDEALKLGMLELVEEDLALCTFVCPSLIDFGEILRTGLDLFEKEG